MKKILKEKTVTLHRPKEALALLGITKPTFYKWLSSGVLKKVWPKGVRVDSRGYFIPHANILEVKSNMNGGWSRGKELLKSKGCKK